MRILCVHQGAELYGSDRSFLQAVEAIRRAWPNAHIRVLVAMQGPLIERLRQHADSVEVRDLFVLRLAQLGRTAFKGTIALPYYLARAVADMRRADLVYVNTTVIGDFMLAAALFSDRTVIHAREIPKARAMPVIRNLVRCGRAGVIFNSAATKYAFDLPEGQGQAVVHNGVDPVRNPAPPRVPETFSRERRLRIALLGRINDWKGQDLLIEAVGRLPTDISNRIAVRIVGSPFGESQRPLELLENMIARHGLQKTVDLEPFRDDPGEVYRWADICAVPSRRPEPFGRVAIEAMAEARPVLAANHGGLTEIVAADETGWLFEPNDPVALGAAITEMIDCPQALPVRGQNALDRFERLFSTGAMAKNLQGALVKLVPALKLGR